MLFFAAIHRSISCISKGCMYVLFICINTLLELSNMVRRILNYATASRIMLANCNICLICNRIVYEADKHLNTQLFDCNICIYNMWNCIFGVLNLNDSNTLNSNNYYNILQYAYDYHLTCQSLYVRHCKQH